MATKKATAKAVPEKPKMLNPELHTEIEEICKSAARTVVVDPEMGADIPADKMGRAIDLLALSRALVRNVKADYDAKVKGIVDPFKPYADERKTITKLAEEVERKLEDGLKCLVANGLIGKDGYETKSGCRLSLVGKRELVLDDPEAIPDEFLLPRAQCLDWGAIKARIEANEKAIEAAKEAGITLQLQPLDGAHLITTYTFRTKLPDELES